MFGLALIQLGSTCIVTVGKACTYQVVVLGPFLALPLVMMAYEYYLMYKYCRDRGPPFDYHQFLND